MTFSARKSVGKIFRFHPLRFCSKIAPLSEGVSRGGALGAGKRQERRKKKFGEIFDLGGSILPENRPSYWRDIEGDARDAGKTKLILRFDVTSAVKIQPYQSEGKSVSNAKKFRHTKVRR